MMLKYVAKNEKGQIKADFADDYITAFAVKLFMNSGIYDCDSVEIYEIDVEAHTSTRVELLHGELIRDI